MLADCCPPGIKPWPAPVSSDHLLLIASPSSHPFPSSYDRIHSCPAEQFSDGREPHIELFFSFFLSEFGAKLHHPHACRRDQDNFACLIRVVWVLGTYSLTYRQESPGMIVLVYLSLSTRKRENIGWRKLHSPSQSLSPYAVGTLSPSADRFSLVPQGQSSRSIHRSALHPPCAVNHRSTVGACWLPPSSRSLTFATAEVARCVDRPGGVLRGAWQTPNTSGDMPALILHGSPGAVARLCGG
ncbi:hypothetical protein LX32DRAFT_305483 [Colletotrichum zoysiae]|uniref:Uncharacterized protein n=1 Tax=Colletotrichum zoysiae TaxID=1216348 RepID=A0AAD9HVS3_9PEZI|nr:hypothetical protein LX32DRAFT_305483 [Colletotrichum zoysiae]